MQSRLILTNSSTKTPYYTLNSLSPGLLRRKV
uniref:Uncharacterized protein n=1 Tax=Rhizophora mucronata TaxID=61149 RepID=A0A2P2Q375_RHIMU